MNALTVMQYGLEVVQVSLFDWLRCEFCYTEVGICISWFLVQLDPVSTEIRYSGTSIKRIFKIEDIIQNLSTKDSF